jgi:hypothetical protein
MNVQNDVDEEQWYLLQELQSLGIDPKRLSELDDKQELTNQVENIKPCTRITKHIMASKHLPKVVHSYLFQIPPQPKSLNVFCSFIKTMSAKDEAWFTVYASVKCATMILRSIVLIVHAAGRALTRWWCTE